MLDALLATLLVSISALIGILITYFTRSELKQYKKYIGWARLALLSALILAVAFLGFYDRLSVVGLFVGLIIGWHFRNLKNHFYDWFWLGLLLGCSFAIGRNVGMLTALFVGMYTLIYANYINIPAVLKRVSKSKARVTEQGVFIFISLTAYIALISTGPVAASFMVYAAVGVLVGIFAKESHMIK